MSDGTLNEDGGPAGGPTAQTAPQATSPSGAAGKGLESPPVRPLAFWEPGVSRRCRKCGHEARHHWSPAWCRSWDGRTFTCACRCEATAEDIEATRSGSRQGEKS